MALVGAATPVQIIILLFHVSGGLKLAFRGFAGNLNDNPALCCRQTLTTSAFAGTDHVVVIVSQHPRRSVPTFSRPFVLTSRTFQHRGWSLRRVAIVIKVLPSFSHARLNDVNSMRLKNSKSGTIWSSLHAFRSVDRSAACSLRLSLRLYNSKIPGRPPDSL